MTLKTKQIELIIICNIEIIIEDIQFKYKIQKKLCQDNLIHESEHK